MYMFCFLPNLLSVIVCGIKRHKGESHMKKHMHKRTAISLLEYRWSLLVICWILLLGGEAYWHLRLFQICATQIPDIATCLQLPSYLYTLVGGLVDMRILQRGPVETGALVYKITLVATTAVSTFVDGFKFYIRRMRR